MAPSSTCKLQHTQCTLIAFHSASCSNNVLEQLACTLHAYFARGLLGCLAQAHMNNMQCHSRYYRSFKATEAKVLRVSVNSFCDMCALVLRTLLEFDDEQQQEQRHHDAGGNA
jgi:Transcription factor Pcc1